MTKNVKFILFIFLLFAGTLACSDSEEDPPAILIDREQQSQIVYADEHEKTVHFIAIEAWRTEIDYTSVKASAAAGSWITLDPAQGEAGEITMRVNMDSNMDGKDRKATVRIICGKTTISITVEQKGESAGGETPLPESKKVVSSVDIHTITHFVENTNEYQERYTFKYNEQGHLAEQYFLDEGGYEHVLQLSYAVANEIKITENGTDEYWKVSLNEQGAAVKVEVGNNSMVNGVYRLSYDATGYLSKENWEEYESRYTIDYFWEKGNFVASVYSYQLDAGEDVTRDTLEKGYTYCDTPGNNRLNIDPNLFLSSLGRCNTGGANSYSYSSDKGRLDLLALWGLLGKRSQGYLAEKKVDEYEAGIDPGKDYYYSYDFTFNSLYYDFDSDGVLQKITDETGVKIYKVMKNTGQRLFMKEATDKTTYIFNYKN